MTIDTWLLLVGTVLIFMITPGPSHLLMLSVSMSNGSNCPCRIGTCCRHYQFPAWACDCQMGGCVVSDLGRAASDRGLVQERRWFAGRAVDVTPNAVVSWLHYLGVEPESRRILRRPVPAVFGSPVFACPADCDPGRNLHRRGRMFPRFLWQRRQLVGAEDTQPPQGLGRKGRGDEPRCRGGSAWTQSKRTNVSDWRFRPLATLARVVRRHMHGRSIAINVTVYGLSTATGMNGPT